MLSSTNKLTPKNVYIYPDEHNSFSDYDDYNKYYNTRSLQDLPEIALNTWYSKKGSVEPN